MLKVRKRAWQADFSALRQKFSLLASGGLGGDNFPAPDGLWSNVESCLSGCGYGCIKPVVRGGLRLAAVESTPVGKSRKMPFRKSVKRL